MPVFSIVGQLPTTTLDRQEHTRVLLFLTVLGTESEALCA